MTHWNDVTNNTAVLTVENAAYENEGIYSASYVGSSPLHGAWMRLIVRGRQHRRSMAEIIDPSNTAIHLSTFHQLTSRQTVCSTLLWSQGIHINTHIFKPYTHTAASTLFGCRPKTP